MVKGSLNFKVANSVTGMGWVYFEAVMEVVKGDKDLAVKKYPLKDPMTRPTYLGNRGLPEAWGL